MIDDKPTESVAVILARMEVKLDQSLTQNADHETRIRVLEKKVWLATGLASLFAGGGSAWMTTLLGR